MSLARLATFLEAARDACGSDLHLCAGRPPLVRVDGELRALPYRALDAAELEALVDECASAADREALVTHGTRVLAFDAGRRGPRACQSDVASRRRGRCAATRAAHRAAARGTRPAPRRERSRATT
jgi:Tfp pilus assembly pilus retraction ATPase PilT